MVRRRIGLQLPTRGQRDLYQSRRYCRSATQNVHHKEHKGLTGRRSRRPDYQAIRLSDDDQTKIWQDVHYQSLSSPTIQPFVLFVPLW